MGFAWSSLKMQAMSIFTTYLVREAFTNGLQVCVIFSVSIWCSFYITEAFSWGTFSHFCSTSFAIFSGTV